MSLSLHFQRDHIFSLLSAMHWSALTTDASVLLIQAAIQTAKKRNSPTEKMLSATRTLSVMLGKNKCCFLFFFFFLRSTAFSKKGVSKFYQSQIRLSLKGEIRVIFPCKIYSMSPFCVGASSSYTLDLKISGCD